MVRVFLHTGAGKTGTSAVQVALARLRPALADAGIHYPVGFGNSDERASQGKITSGNAAALGPWLNPNHRRAEYDKQAVTDWLRAAMDAAAGRDLLLSSELMQFPRPDEAAELCGLFGAAGYTPTVIFYVRHALDQSIATYLQHLKRGFVGMPRRDEIGGMGDFLRLHKVTYLASLQPFAKVLSAEQIMVRLYDDEASALVPRFLRLVSDRSFAIPETERVINRSPSRVEQAVFLALGKLPDGPRICQVASDLLLNREAPREALRVSAADLAAFTERNQPVVNEINSRFLRGQGTLLVKSDRIEVGEVAAPGQAEVMAAFAEAFALLATEQRRAGAGRRAGIR